MPLIVHLPADLRDNVNADWSALSFTTDLAPTHALLGQEPQPACFGRPLSQGRRFVRRPPTEERPSCRACGALLMTRAVYISTASPSRYSYELDGTGAGRATTVRDEDRVRSQRAIRDRESCGNYGYRPPQSAGCARARRSLSEKRPLTGRPVDRWTRSTAAAGGLGDAHHRLEGLSGSDRAQYWPSVADPRWLARDQPDRRVFRCGAESLPPAHDLVIAGRLRRQGDGHQGWCRRTSRRRPSRS